MDRSQLLSWQQHSHGGRCGYIIDQPGRTQPNGPGDQYWTFNTLHRLERLRMNDGKILHLKFGKETPPPIEAMTSAERSPSSTISARIEKSSRQRRCTLPFRRTQTLIRELMAKPSVLAP